MQVHITSTHEEITTITYTHNDDLRSYLKSASLQIETDKNGHQTATITRNPGPFHESDGYLTLPLETLKDLCRGIFVEQQLAWPSNIISFDKKEIK